MLTVKELAHALEKSENTTYRMIKQGEVNAVRLGVGRGRLMIERAELDRLLQQHEQPIRNISEVDKLITEWCALAGSSDLTVVLRWLAEQSLQFRVRYPHVAQQEARAIRNSSGLRLTS